MQDIACQRAVLRMVKIGATFTKFQRVIHDVARELGRTSRFGDLRRDTELDKTVVEIGDPLRPSGAQRH